MDEGNTIGVIYFDFTKAFDSAKHRFPMTYMKSFGLGDVAVQWIDIYLSGRIVRVHIGGELLGAIPMRSDIPHGFVIGPFTLLHFVNDLQMPSKH